MRLDDLHASVVVEEDRDLIARLRGARTGEYGEFELYHDEQGPILCVFVNASTRGWL